MTTLAKEIMSVPLWKRRPSRTWPAPVYYPESDGEPMAETDVHRDLMVYLIETLKDHYRNDPQVYIAGNLFLYYMEGKPAFSVSPDVLVVFGIPKRQRRVYKVWVEGKAPDVVFEMTSRSTQKKDLGDKKRLYAQLGVQEYYLFDPLREYLAPPLQGYTLQEGEYRLMEGRPLVSQVLGLEVCEEGKDWLRLYDPQTGQKLLTPLEAQAARRQEATARRQAEIARRQEAFARRQAEERAAQEAEARHQEAFARRQAEDRATQEAEARRQAETEMERLRAELAHLRGA